VEAWLNDTLREAEYFGLPSTVKRTRAAAATQDYQIDRQTLSNSGLRGDSIDDLYKSLFVYTVGFYHKIRDLAKQHACLAMPDRAQDQHKTQGSLLSSIWRVYAILMEYLQATDYKTQVMRVLDESSKILEHKEEFYQKLLDLEE